MLFTSVIRKMVLIVVALTACTLFMSAQSVPDKLNFAERSGQGQPNHDRLLNHLWIASLCAVAASTSFDAATSWGYRESNGLLASSSGAFGPRGVSLKVAAAAAVIVPQILLRHHRSMKPAFIIGNLAESGVFTGAAVHNIHVRDGSQ